MPLDPDTGEVVIPFLRTQHNYDTMAASNESAIYCEDESFTQQQFRDESDINVIVERFGLTGRMPENPSIPSYGDFSGISDYREAIHAVRAAEAGFMAFPAPLRARFQNDPQQLLEFVANKGNYQEAVQLGLIKPPPAPPLAPASAPPHSPGT